MNGNQRRQVGKPENGMGPENYSLREKLTYIDNLKGNLHEPTVLALAKMLSLFNVFESTLFSKERFTVEERCRGFCKHLSQYYPDGSGPLRHGAVYHFCDVFRDRYLYKNGTANDRMDDLFPRISRNRRNELANALMSYQGDEKTDHLRSFLALAYQYRNNLYHGRKGVDSLNEFCEYFDAISGLLAFLLQLYSKTDMCDPDTCEPLKF